MFTFRTATINFFVFLFLLNLLSVSGYHIPFWYYLTLVGIYLSLSVTLSFFIRTNFHMNAYSRVKTAEKIIAISFDDGPDIEITPRILDLLKKESVPATFFCIGRKIKGNEELLRRMVFEGHCIGTHSFSHSNWFDLYSPARMKKEFLQSESEIIQVTGKRPLFFRPPYGVINPMVRKALKDTGYHVIGFSNRAWDTTSRNREKVLERLCRKLKPGDIILLHDTVKENEEVVPEFLTYAKTNGFRIIPLDQLLNLPSYEL
jgi:peptidoglycan-N-acetylglucosamine deacetylase